MPYAALALLLLVSVAIQAEQLRYDSASDWRVWRLPLGAIEILTTGSLQPVRIRKDTDAARDARDLGGGIRRPRRAAYHRRRPANRLGTRPGG